MICKHDWDITTRWTTGISIKAIHHCICKKCLITKIVKD